MDTQAYISHNTGTRRSSAVRLAVPARRSGSGIGGRGASGYVFCFFSAFRGMTFMGIFYQHKREVFGD
jgi:hypothetical protein